MKEKIKKLVMQLLRSPRMFPVEACMGLAFFAIAACHTGMHGKEWGWMNADILGLFVPLLVLTFWLHKVNRWAYVVSGLLFVPLMALNLKPFLQTYGFGFTYVLAGILLLLGVRRMGNRSFATHALHVVTQLFLGIVVAGLLTGAVMAIVSSFLYIFGLEEPRHLYEYILEFIWFAIAPQICCTFISQGEDEEKEPAKVLELIINYILSPAIIIYTVILYAYILKIVFTWDLPKGGVAWMVMGFVTAALAGRLMQYVLERRHYDWFYRYFPWIAIPPLVMYWVGSIYRIHLYSFTESRFYLMVAGGLMTLFVGMLIWRRSRSFQLMAVICGVAIIAFTYIPGISAKSIGFNCQMKRMMRYISELNLMDAKTGKFVSKLDWQKINSDSTLCSQYREACSIINYVSYEMGFDEFREKYGRWNWSSYEFNVEEQKIANHWFRRENSINLEEYNIMLPEEGVFISVDEGNVLAKMKEKPVLVYPIQERIRQHPALLDEPDSLLVWKNDSLMIVLDEICVDEKKMTVTSGYRGHLFRKTKPGFPEKAKEDE